MTHPTNEDWMTLLYGESAGVERARLEHHLSDCAECRKRFARWSGTRRDLDAWKLPRAQRRGPALIRQWAAAAAIVILALAGGLRLWKLETDVRALRSQVAAMEMNDGNALAPKLEASYAELERRHLQDQQALLSALAKVQAANAENFARLRRELETVAIFAEAGLRDAQNEIANIAYIPREQLEPNKQ